MTQGPGISRRSSRSFAKRGSSGGSWACAAGSTSFSETPQTVAEPGAVGPAEEPLGQRQHDRVVEPGVGVEQALGDVGAAQLRVVRVALIDLAGVDRELEPRRPEAAGAGRRGRRLGRSRSA